MGSLSKDAIAAVLALLLDLSSPVASAACYEQAAAHYGVDVALLKAIAEQESGFNPSSTHLNTDGSEDIGEMMINSSWLRKLAPFGIKRHHLFDACLNEHIGAWVLASNIKQFKGDTWKAVGAYNAKTAWRQRAYAMAIWKRLKKPA